MTFNGGVAVLQYYSITNKGREFENMRVCQNTYPLFYDKAPTFPSRGFVIT